MVPSTGAKPSGAAQGLKKAHDDDNFLVATTTPPFQKPPKVQAQVGRRRKLFFLISEPYNIN
jgi:hypothetical protein